MLRHYWDLIWYKAYADLRAEHERTYLGFAWWVLEPMMFMGVFYLVFDLVLRQSGTDFVPFLLVGLVAWQWLKSCVSNGASILLNNLPLMRQIYLPKLVFPLILIVTDTIKFGFVFVLLMVFLWGYGYRFNHTLLALPLVLLVELILITGLTLIVAALVPFFPDIRFIIENVLQALMFLSGVFFSAALLHEHIRPYFYLNPIVGLLDAYRAILLHQQWPDPVSLTQTALGALLLVGVGVWLFRRLDYLYPKLSG